MRLRLSRQADEDLIVIYAYGVSTFGTAQAELYFSELAATLELISRTPFMAREYRELKPPVRMHPHGRHLIVYTTETEGVFVVRILDNRRDWLSLFSQAQ